MGRVGKQHCFRLAPDMQFLEESLNAARYSMPRPSGVQRKRPREDMFMDGQTAARSLHPPSAPLFHVNVRGNSVGTRGSGPSMLDTALAKANQCNRVVEHCASLPVGHA